MKKKYQKKIVIFALLIFAIAITGCKNKETKDSNIDIYPLQKDDKYGFISTDGEFIIEPQYDFALGFYEDIAAVVKDGKMGYINKKGETVIDFKYDYIEGNAYNTYYKHNFKDGISIVTEGNEDNNQCYYIDKSGKQIIEKKFKQCFQFDEDEMALTKDDSGKGTYINKKGEKVEPKAKAIAISNLCLESVYNKESNNYDKYYVDCSTNKSIWPTHYLNAENFINGLARVTDLETEKKGVINEQGQYIIQPIFNIIEPFNTEGVAIVGKQYNNITRYGIIDTDGIMQVTTDWTNYYEYEDIYLFKYDYAVLITKKDGTKISEFNIEV